MKKKNVEQLSGMFTELLEETGAAHIDDKTSAAGKKAVTKMLEREGLKYNISSLRAVRAGMTILLSSPDKELNVPMLLTVSKLIKEEK